MEEELPDKIQEVEYNLNNKYIYIYVCMNVCIFSISNIWDIVILKKFFMYLKIKFNRLCALCFYLLSPATLSGGIIR